MRDNTSRDIIYYELLSIDNNVLTALSALGTTVTTKISNIQISDNSLEGDLNSGLRLGISTRKFEFINADISMTGEIQKVLKQDAIETFNKARSYNAKAGLVGKSGILIPMLNKMLFIADINATNLIVPPISTELQLTSRFRYLREAKILGKIEELPSYYFCSTTAKINKIELPETLLTIGDWALSGNKLLKEISIPASVTLIGKEAFCQCNSLEQVDFNNKQRLTNARSCREIQFGTGVFTGCASLAEVELPIGLKYISPYTFSFCNSLKRLIIPNTVTEISPLALGFPDDAAKIPLEYIKYPAKLEEDVIDLVSVMLDRKITFDSY